MGGRLLGSCVDNLGYLEQFWVEVAEIGGGGVAGKLVGFRGCERFGRGRSRWRGSRRVDGAGCDVLGVSTGSGLEASDRTGDISIKQTNRRISLQAR